jgi:hypothetical protein
MDIRGTLKHSLEPVFSYFSEDYKKEVQQDDRISRDISPNKLPLS